MDKPTPKLRPYQEDQDLTDRLITQPSGDLEWDRLQRWQASWMRGEGDDYWAQSEPGWRVGHNPRGENHQLTGDFAVVRDRWCDFWGLRWPDEYADPEAKIKMAHGLVLVEWWDGPTAWSLAWKADLQVICDDEMFLGYWWNAKGKDRADPEPTPYEQKWHRTL